MVASSAMGESQCRRMGSPGLVGTGRPLVLARWVSQEALTLKGLRATIAVKFFPAHGRGDANPDLSRDLKLAADAVAARFHVCGRCQRCHALHQWHRLDQRWQCSQILGTVLW